MKALTIFVGYVALMATDLLYNNGEGTRWLISLLGIG